MEVKRRSHGEERGSVETVAVAGGSCSSLAGLAAGLGADAFLTADIKHHHGIEAVTERGPEAMALIDAAHWATEAPWLDALAARLRDRFGASVEVTVSRLVTDPWTVHAP